MRRLIVLIMALCLAAAIPVSATAEDGMTRISDVFGIDEPTGMAYISTDGDYCDLFPMDCDHSSHEEGSEAYWAIWDVLKSAPLYAAQLPAGETAAPTRASLPAAEDNYGQIRVESGEDFFAINLYEGWNVLHISAQRGEETTDIGWFIVLGEGDMDALNAIRAVYEN